MSIDAAFKPDAQLVEGGQPRVRSLDHPTVASEPVVALDASAGDAILDAATFEVGAAARVWDQLIATATCVDATLQRVQARLPAGFPSAVWEKTAAGIRTHAAQFLRELMLAGRTV